MTLALVLVGHVHPPSPTPSLGGVAGSSLGIHSTTACLSNLVSQTHFCVAVQIGTQLPGGVSLLVAHSGPTCVLAMPENLLSVAKYG